MRASAGFSATAPSAQGWEVAKTYETGSVDSLPGPVAPAPRMSVPVVPLPLFHAAVSAPVTTTGFAPSLAATMLKTT